MVFLGWRFLLVRWFKPKDEALLSPQVPQVLGKAAQHQQAEAAIKNLIQTARDDGPPWGNWSLFFQRCQQLIEAIALIYAPQSKRPLLNIYVPQAYGLLRGTVDDVDLWMQKLSPVLGQVTLEQAYSAYETYQKLEPAARLAIKAWNTAQWVFNPLVALARTTTQGYSAQANQELVMNLGQMMREATLKALGERAIALYSGEAAQISLEEAAPAQTQTLREIFSQAPDQRVSDQQPLNLLLLGRTGAGKSSLINTLFREDFSNQPSSFASVVSCGILRPEPRPPPRLLITTPSRWERLRG